MFLNHLAPTVDVPYNFVQMASPLLLWAVLIMLLHLVGSVSLLLSLQVELGPAVWAPADGDMMITTGRIILMHSPPAKEETIQTTHEANVPHY